MKLLCTTGTPGFDPLIPALTRKLGRTSHQRKIPVVLTLEKVIELITDTRSLSLSRREADIALRLAPVEQH